MIDKIFIQLLNKVDTKQLDRLITQDVSLVQRYYINDISTKSKIDTFMKPLLPFLKFDKEDFKVDTLLANIYKGNSDVYRIIVNHPNGIMWMCKQVEEIARQLHLEKQKLGVLGNLFS